MRVSIDCAFFLLEYSQKNSSYHETGIVLNKTRAGHDNTPASDQNSKVGRGALKPFENYVTRDFEQHVWYKDCFQGHVSDRELLGPFYYS